MSGEVTRRINRKTVAVDFDGVIHAYSRGWEDGVIYDEPVPGVRHALRELVQDYDIVVFTARTDLDPVRAWLDEHALSLYVTEVTNNKPQAQCYIDDRAVHFDGDWTVALENAHDVIAFHAERKQREGRT